MSIKNKSHFSITKCNFICAYFIREDLDNYYDLAHYSPGLTTKIVQCFKNKEYLLTKENIDKRYDEYIKYIENIKDAYK